MFDIYWKIVLKVARTEHHIRNIDMMKLTNKVTIMIEDEWYDGSSKR